MKKPGWRVSRNCRGRDNIMLRAFGIYREEVNDPEGDPGSYDNKEGRGEIPNDEKARLAFKVENAEREMVT
jgi:hypothetical protein